MGYIRNNENGAVLITGLMILLIMTLVGIAAMNNSGLQEVMSRNQASRGLAFQAAEAALREAEDYLNGATLPTFTGSDGLYSSEVDLSTLSWNSSDSAEALTALTITAPTKPRYIIEELVDVEDVGSDSLTAGAEVTTNMVYRVTARGVGLQSTTVVILQSTFLR